MLDLKRFHRRLESILADLGPRHAGERAAHLLVPRILEHLGPLLDLRGGQLHVHDGGSLRLVRQWGDEAPDLSGPLPRRASPAEGTEDLPWVGATPAGLTGLLGFGARDEHVLALVSAHPPTERPALIELGAAISALDYALRQHGRHRELEGILDQARAIQISLLPDGRPRFGDFDIAALSLPAASVGGDLYDFIHLDAETLALAVADASGHGFPAALQARDVVTGLRMGTERDLKITRTVEKLNRIIHRSGLVSRFVSLFFGELETNGNLAYINAGHPPPLLLDGAGFHELTVGGMILGPNPDALYKLGFAHVDRGAILAAYTDGVVERRGPEGEHYGVERVRAWMRGWTDGPADRACDQLVAELRDFGGGAPFEDDVTVLCVRRPR